jgi:hypothetical protein
MARRPRPLRPLRHRTPRVTGPIVLDTFRKAFATHGIPASTLTDKGMVFTTRLSGGKGGRNGFENELRRLGVTQINSTANPAPPPSSNCKPSSTPSTPSTTTVSLKWLVWDWLAGLAE